MQLTKRIQAVLKFAEKKQVLYYNPNSMEFVEDHLLNTSVHGYTSVDVDGFWMPSSIFEYLNANYSGFIEAYKEFGFFTAFKFLSIKCPWSGWTWVIDSMDSIKFEIARDESIKNKTKDFRKIKESITDEQVIGYLSEHYYKLTDALWILKNDSSVIAYDEKIKPFALKDGWAALQIGEILEEWYMGLTKKKIKVKYKEV